MANPERLRPFAQRRRSDMTLKHYSEADRLEQSGPISYTPRHGSPVPRIASLDILVPGKMAGTRCSSAKSEYSAVSSPWPSGPDDGVFFQDRDVADRSVSLDHMINTLHHVMMTKGVLDPVPVEHNSCILHLLEGYWKLHEQHRKTEQVLAEERVTKKRSLEEFIKMSTEWEQKEASFLAEIKRLELLLAEVSPGGVGAVVVARSGSVVDRSARSSKLFKARVERARSPKKDSGDSAVSNNLDYCAMPESPRRTHKTLLSMHPVLDGNADAELSDRLRNAQVRRNAKKEHPELQNSHIQAKAVRTFHRGEKLNRDAKGCTAKSGFVETPQQTALMSPEVPRPPSLSAPSSPGSRHFHRQNLRAEDRQPDSAVLPTSNSPDTPGGDQLGIWKTACGECHHKREFSFDTGEDSIPRLPFVSPVTKDNLSSGNWPNRNTTLGSEKRAPATSSSNLAQHEHGAQPGDEPVQSETMDSP
ncbi:hypothetical protein CPLU01_14843 [Colletotrichum plurivorum]|uniref:Uncharacterized protein n=1 Tax=Colletotrichum plurivorum TaxID=2175906 RepID=A0A8H6MY96_9PEZI|nr:hypothetical protein CPLU01_14843 [Colletotrichum plurivorum]